MSSLFYLALLVCLVIPVLASHALRINRVLPVVFLQLLFGLCVHMSRLDAWLQVQGVSFVHGAMADSFRSMGLLGVLLLIAMTGSESGTREPGDHVWRFIPISIVGFVSTSALGAAIGYVLYHFCPGLKGVNADVYSFSLAIGLSLAVTALPVLTALLQETRLFETALGKLAVNCALMDELWMWLGMALVLSLSRITRIEQPVAFGWLLAYLILMCLIFRPLFRRWFDIRPVNNVKDRFLLIISIILLSAAVTEIIGIHSFLGAFVAGFVLPQKLLQGVRESLLNISQTLLLPLFFILTGMRLNINMSDGVFWQLTAIVTLAAVVGKVFSVALMARFVGLNWSQSFVLGGLMQCKGLMELVALNILFEAGVIGAQIFSALAMMALISTLVTVPLIQWWLRGWKLAPNGVVGHWSQSGR